MSYDISLRDKDSGKTLHLDKPHSMTGGTYILGGTDETWLNVTYNYAEHFRRVFGNNGGIRCIYGKSGAESIPMLKSAISQLGDDVNENDYWEATEGNVKKSLCNLLEMAKLRPDGIWGGD